jgi:UDP-glucose:(heptosyl)LPS alpha-1,3-glucosyltransferase
MRIALVILNYGATKGGAERAAANLARGLTLRGHRVTVLSDTFEGADKGVEWRRVRALKLASALKHVSFARNVEKTLAHESFDIVQAFTRTHRCDVYRVGGGVHSEYLKRVERNRSAVGRLLSRANPKNAMTARLETKSFAPGAYRKIVAVSRRCKQEILANYPVAERDIWVIYNGVDTDLFHPENGRRLRGDKRRALGLEREDVVSLFAANGWRTKGLNYAIDALRTLPARFKMVVAGKGRASEYDDLGGRVQILGPRSDVAELHAAADLLVHPSLHDPFPNSCLEALASGLPVVTTAVTGVAEIMTEGREGFILDDPSRVDLLAKRLEVLGDEGVRRPMGEAARRIAEEHTISRYTQSHLALYEEL